MDIHDRLNLLIDRNSPKAAKFLVRMWNDQQDAITYKELREAIQNGSLTVDDFLAWQNDYIVFLNECYAPLVEHVIKQAHDLLVAQYGGFLIDPMHDTMSRFINEHGGQLIRQVSEQQFKAINVLVREASLSGNLTVDELARSIRPCIGLTERQAAQTQRFYEQLRKDGYSKKEALKRQQTFAEKIHRRRAQTIAETEMAYAANYGMDAVIHDNIDAGIISPDVEKEWSTARDERVCDECGSVHGECIPEDEEFSNGCFLPPAHPRCRCAVKYLLKAAEKPVLPGVRETAVG